MTIEGWMLFFCFAAIMIVAGGSCIYVFKSVPVKILSGAVSIFLIFGLLFGMLWYFGNTASGQRALTDEKSELNNGIERTITVYTADGKIIAQYTGKIDIEGNDGGYVLFDFEGKRYIYYNCFVESIAEIK